MQVHSGSLPAEQVLDSVARRGQPWAKEMAPARSSILPGTVSPWRLPFPASWPDDDEWHEWRCPVAHMFQGLPGLAYAFANGSGCGLGAMFNGLAGLFRRVLIVLS